MGRHRAPAAVPALGIVAGAVLAPRLAQLPLGAVFALLALALALRGRSAALLVGLCLGLLSSGVQPPLGLGRTVDPGRPAVVAGRIISHPVRRPDGTFFRLRTVSLRQGRRVTVAAADVWITLPPEAESPGLGAEVRLRGYLRRSAGFADGLAARRRVADPPAWRMRLKSSLFLAIEEPPGPAPRLAAALRRGVEGLLDRCPAPSRFLPLVRALVLGDRSQLPMSWRQALRRSGLAHLLAVSGLHVALVALVVMLSASALPPRLRLLAAMAGIAAYLLLIGPRPSVLRASAMGLLAAAALASDRPPQGLNALACGVSLLLVWEPAMAADLSFQLSAAAAAGILLLSPLLAERWRHALPGPLRRPLSVSLAAQAATLPWILPLTGGLHPLAIPLNLVAVPYLAVFLFASFLWLAAAALSRAAGALLLPWMEGLAAPLELLSSLPPATVLFRTLDPAALPLLVALLLAALAWGFLPGKRPAVLWRGALVGILLLASGSRPAGPGRGPAAGGPVELAVLDVGQGDAILIRDGSRAVLVDGGGWRTGDFGGRLLVPVLAAAGLHRLDALVLTHPDVDHCGGLVDVARYLPVAELWMSPGWQDRPCAGSLLATPGKRWRSLWAGRRRSLGRWRLTALHPPPREAAGDSAAGGLRLQRRGRNDHSLVLMAEIFGRRVLLTGDIGSDAEERLAAAPCLRADVLKVAHHGSKTSTTAAFLRAVAPRLAVISAGAANPYGHPAPPVLERLAAAGVRVLRTDRSGMIRLRFAAGGESTPGESTPGESTPGESTPGHMAIELPGSPPG